MSDSEAAILAALANGVIPADDRDSGAADVNAGARLAEKLAAGPTATVYRAGVTLAVDLAKSQFDRPVAGLDPGQMHDLLRRLREQRPALFKQLRMDVCSLYLSDPGVWARIGFPGPSTAQGGYPDFDRPQAR